MQHNDSLKICSLLYRTRFLARVDFHYFTTTILKQKYLHLPNFPNCIQTVMCKYKIYIFLIQEIVRNIVRQVTIDGERRMQFGKKRFSTNMYNTLLS